MFIVLNIWIIISRKQGVSLGAAQAAAKLRMPFCLSAIQCSLSRRRFTAAHGVRLFYLKIYFIHLYTVLY